MLHSNCTAAKWVIITILECSWLNTASNWISSFILNILWNLIEFQKLSHRYGLHFSPQHRFNYIYIYTIYSYSTIFPLYSFFCLTVPTLLFSAEGTHRDAAGNLDRGETFAICLRQVGPNVFGCVSMT